eukprot:Platyproteum_vivax@DN5267_c0_g1_i3.p1
MHAHVVPFACFSSQQHRYFRYAFWRVRTSAVPEWLQVVQSYVPNLKPYSLENVNPDERPGGNFSIKQSRKMDLPEFGAPMSTKKEKKQKVEVKDIKEVKEEKEEATEMEDPELVIQRVRRPWGAKK